MEYFLLPTIFFLVWLSNTLHISACVTHEGQGDFTDEENEPFVDILFRNVGNGPLS